MARSLPTSSYAVLGLLSLTPMSGYELAQAVDKSIGNFWPMSKTQVYSELGRLDSLGLVQGAAVEQERLPDKRVFTVTPAGERALDQWLCAPEFEEGTLREPTMVKLFFGHRMDRATLTGLLDRFAGESEVDVEGMKAIIEVLGGVPKAAHAWATALYGLRMHEACFRWAREVRERLASEDWAGAKHEPHGDSELVRNLFAATPVRSRRRRALSEG